MQLLRYLKRAHGPASRPLHPCPCTHAPNACATTLPDPSQSTQPGPKDSVHDELFLLNTPQAFSYQHFSDHVFKVGLLRGAGPRVKGSRLPVFKVGLGV